MKTYKWSELREDLSPEARARLDERVKAELAEMEAPVTVTLQGENAVFLRDQAARQHKTPAAIIGEWVRQSIGKAAVL